MSKYYFFNKESEICYPLSSIKKMIKSSGHKEKEVFEAKIIYGEDFMFCKHYSEVGDKGNCGIDCEHYKPRNKVSGNCIHTGYLYEHDKKVIIEIKPEPQFIFPNDLGDPTKEHLK